METMAGIIKDQYAVPEPLLSTGVKNFLDKYKLGRAGLQVGRKIIGFLRKSRDPIQRKLWIGRFSLPLRNAMLLNRPLAISLEGVSVQLVPHGQTAASFWTGRRFERHEDAFILSVLEPGMVFFDVGANAGLFAIGVAKKIGGSRVFAFEPCSSTCDLLRQNLKLNHLVDVNVEQEALGDFVGVEALQIHARGKDGLHTLGKAPHPESLAVGQENVRVTTTDEFMKDHKVPRVDVLKVDVQGAELMVLRGARRLLERPDAPVILYECFGFLTRRFGYHPVEIIWLLESCGYALFVLNYKTGEINELASDYQYDSVVIAVKPGHACHSKLHGVAR
jgi:FkbM family methyltransferase